MLEKYWKYHKNKYDAFLIAFEACVTVKLYFFLETLSFESKSQKKILQKCLKNEIKKTNRFQNRIH